MSVYRDDLTAARERIRALEEELASIHQREATALDTDSHDLVRPSSSRTAALVALVGALVVGFVALRVPTIAPLSVVAFLVLVLVLVLRGRTFVVRPNEVAVVQSRSAQSAQPATWIGPGRVVQLKRSATVESLSLRALPVSWTSEDVSTADAHIDVDLFAVVAVRRDEEGIVRAVRTFGSGSVAPITQAALDDALRLCAKDTPLSYFLDRDAGLRDRMRRKGRESLDELGVKLVTIGTLDVRKRESVLKERER